MPGLVLGINVLKTYLRRRTWMAGTSPAMTEHTRCLLASNDRIIQIIPFRIIRQNQSHFPFSRPMLDVVLALDRGLNIFVTLEVNESLDGIPLGKSCDQAVPVFVNP